MSVHLETIQRALREDLALAGDITSNSIYSEVETAKANFICESSGLLSGLKVLEECFKEYDNTCKVSIFKKDSDYIKPGDVIASAEGSIRTLLAVERTALNFLSHLSGIATSANEFVQAISATNAQLKDTRKTIPGLRMLQKEAVRHGGGVNHRLGLFDAILIKDNHLENISIEEAVEKVRKNNPDKQIELEVENFEQVIKGLACGVGILLLDNMTPSQLKEAVRIVDKKAITEASGGVNLENIRLIAESGVDYISSSAITMASQPLAFKLEIEEK